MNKVLMVVMMAMGLACSAGTDETQDEEAEFASVEQPIFMPEGYGADKNQNRCGNPFAGGECRVPDRRDWIFEWPCDDNGFDCQRLCTDATVRKGIETAAKNMSSFLNAQGWSTSARKATGREPGGKVVRMRCDNGPTSGTVGAATTIPSLCLQSDTDCHSTPRGQLFQYGSATITVFPNRVKNLGSIQGGYASLTAAQQRLLFTNIVAHEFGHVSGLGHADAATSPLMGFGSQGAMPGINTTLQPTTDEKNWWKCYNESSGTNSRCP